MAHHADPRSDAESIAEERATSPATLASIPAEGRPYQGRPAGIVSRIIADGLDIIAVMVVVVALYGVTAALWAISSPRGFHWPENIGWTIPVVAIVVSFVYLTFGWSTTGRTVGKSVMGLRVVGRRGQRISLVRAALRSIAYIALPVGLLWVAISRSNLSVWDIVVRTRVIYDWIPRTDE